ncbi:MAG TPA: hypothetical protein ENI99_08730, partial [Sedimenticola sp.]|nr:hypothetical protein [Sedimenticola sp.]
MNRRLGFLLLPIVAVGLTACQQSTQVKEEAAASVAKAKVPGLQPVPSLTQEEMDKAAYIYFDRCSGCHGALRQGATGPNITPAKTRKKSLAKLEKILWEGTDGGMPGWGKDGKLTKAETQLLAKFVQNEPPQPPPWGLKEMMASWKVHVPVDKRPTKPPARNWQNFFGVVQRDAGKVSIVDGDTKEIIST